MKSDTIQKRNLILLLSIITILLNTETVASGSVGLQVQIPEDPFVVLEYSEDWQNIIKLERQLESEPTLPENIRNELQNKIEDIKHKVTAINASGSQFRMLGLRFKNEMLELDAQYRELDSKYTSILEQSQPESEEELKEIKDKYQAELLELDEKKAKLGLRIDEHNQRFINGPLQEANSLFEQQVKPLLTEFQNVVTEITSNRKIGSAQNVSGNVYCEDTGGEIREITSGMPIFDKSICRTGPDGKIEILMLDQTVFMLGPNSEIIFDEFSYESSGLSGRIITTLKKGILRFKTGNIKDMRVRTSKCNIAVRGTGGIIRVTSDDLNSYKDTTQVTILHGEVEIVSDDKEDYVTVKRGEEVSIGSDGTIGSVENVNTSQVEKQWRVETGIAWSIPESDDDFLSFRISKELLKKVGLTALFILPLLLFFILITCLNFSFLDFREIHGIEKSFWIILGLATYKSISVAHNPDATPWQNLKSLMLIGGIILAIIYTFPAIILDIQHRITDFFNSLLRKFSGAWFAKSIAVVFFASGIFLAISGGCEWIKYMWHFFVKYPLEVPNTGWRSDTSGMYLVAAFGSMAALNSVWLFLPPRKDYFKKKPRRQPPFEFRSKKGLYGALTGCVLGMGMSLFFPLKSIWLPIIGWIIGELLPSSKSTIKRSWATLVGVIVGTAAMILLIVSGPPPIILLLLPALFVLVAYNIEKSLDKRKAVKAVESSETIEETTWEDASQKPEYIQSVICSVCGNQVGKRNRVECLICGEIVHSKNCSSEEGTDAYICENCYAEPEQQIVEESEQELDEQPDIPSNPKLGMETSVTLEPADELLSVRLNRLFAACNSMRNYRPVGYNNARRQLDTVREELTASPARKRMIENRVSELSGGTFHWDP